MFSKGGRDLIHRLTLVGILFGLWLLLSGIFAPLLLVLGLIACVFVVRIALRMDVVDREGYPTHLNPLQVLKYLVWLAGEIIKSNLDVSRRILDPKLPISPTVARVHSSQASQLGQVIYANSITLTPGTVSINLWEGEIRVHALTREAAERLREGEMDRRVTIVEGD